MAELKMLKGSNNRISTADRGVPEREDSGSAEL